MLPPPPHYEPVQPFLMQGDIGYYPFAQVVAMADHDALPNAKMPPSQPAVPVFEGMTVTPIVVDGNRYLLRQWTGLGIVIDHTSELRNSPNDSRVTVAPLVPANASGLHWETAMAGMYVGVLPFPPCARHAAVGGVPEDDWAPAVGVVRSVTTLSRSVVEARRMMTLTPPMTALLAAKLAEYFGERQWARRSHLGNVLDQPLIEVLDVGRPEPPPEKGTWVVLNFANKERLQVFLNPKP